MSEVTLEDVIAILHHEKISNRVVNLWAVLMKHKFAETDLWRYITIFCSTCWPREGGGQDVHLERANILVTYIERKIKEIYGRSNPGVVFTKPKFMACLQQEATSVDCGVVECSVIENLISGKWMKIGTMTHASAGNFRKKMVEQFMVSPFFIKRV
ncbi:hypothetical protein OROMI_011412 [Orobanche minor]